MTYLFHQENNFGNLSVDDNQIASFVAGDHNFDQAFKQSKPELTQTPEMKYEPSYAPAPGVRM